MSQMVLLMGLKKSLTAPMSTTMNGVFEGMVLHISTQKASLASVVLATFVTKANLVLAGGGWSWIPYDTVTVVQRHWVGLVYSTCQHKRRVQGQPSPREDANGGSCSLFDLAWSW